MKTKLLIPLAILLVVGVFFAMNLGPQVPQEYVDLTAVEAQARLEANPEVRILDIRTPKEFDAGHLEGAMNIDYYGEGFKARLDALDKDAVYLVYCRTGNRSSSSLRAFADLGFKRIFHLKHGIVDWMGQGLPLVR